MFESYDSCRRVSRTLEGGLLGPRVDLRFGRRVGTLLDLGIEISSGHFCLANRSKTIETSFELFLRLSTASNELRFCLSAFLIKLLSLEIFKLNYSLKIFELLEFAE